MTFDAFSVDVPFTRRRGIELPHELGAPTFVIQRRVNMPLSTVQRGLADRTPLVPSRRIELGTAGSVVVNAAFRPVAPLSARQTIPTWCGTAQLLTPRGTRVAAVDVEVSMWSSTATCITVRPVTRHPERWSRRRLRQYFTLAHETIDAIAVVLVRRAIEVEAVAAPADDAFERRGARAGIAR